MRPVLFTRATAVFELVHVMPRPVRTFPAASRVVAVACVVCPAVRVDAARLTETLATGTAGGAFTVIAEVAVFPSDVAVMVALPGPTAVTRPPDEDTLATDEFELDQATVRPERSWLSASYIEAESWNVPPVMSDALTGLMITLATGAMTTVTAWPPVTPSAAALIELVPGANAITNPASLTDATLEFEVLHATGLLVTVAPELSRSDAVAVDV
jgi:hypothetical protein